MNLYWQNLKELLIRHLRLDQLRDAYFRLSARERTIVLASAAVGGVLLLLIVISAFLHTIHSMEDDLQKDRQMLMQIESLKKKYDSSRRQVEHIEELIKRTSVAFSLASHLESLAQSYGIQPDSMNPRSVTPNELYTENQIEVRIPKLTLPTLIDYLYKIENSQGFIRVGSLNIKPNYSDPTYISAVFTVSAFTSKER